MKKRYLFILFGFLVLVAVFSVFYRNSKEVIAPSPKAMETEGDISQLPLLATQNENLNVVFPKANEIIQNPLVVKGFARGVWYFEASFPVKIIDASGKIIGRGIAQAEGDWMTEKFVPFSGTISFIAKEGEKGEVVFEKDNPSGLPEHADELRVPVIFGKKSTL